MKALLKAVVATAIIYSSSAIAADLPVQQPVYKAPPTAALDFWSGWYVGGNVGYGWGSPSTTGLSATTNGFEGGAQFGYRRLMLNNFVLGLEGDFDFGSVSGTKAINKNVSATFKTDFLSSQRVVLGYVIPSIPALMIYATGGIAESNSKLSVAAGKTALSDSEHPYGWTIGGGAEYQLGGLSTTLANWSAGVEYRYSDFGNTAYCANFGGGACIGVHVKDTDNAILAKANYRFAM